MADSASAICPLPPDVIAKIRSSIIITSLNVVVLELLKNSLDAQAYKIDITVEYGRGSCTVEDDGVGIQPADFKDGGGLGKLYHTSKHATASATHGSQGSFLASLAALSLVQITSHHHHYHSHNSLSMNRSHVIARQVPAPPHQNILVSNHGTRVAVRDLFGNMPVRVKQRAIEMDRHSGYGRDWEDLRRLVTSVVLAWPGNVLVTVRDVVSDRKLVLRGSRIADTNKNLETESVFVAHIYNTLSHASFISTPERSKWVPVTASTTNLAIQGAISLSAAPTKAVQFLSLGIHPLCVQSHSVLFEEINRLFNNSDFGMEDRLIEIDNVERKRRAEDGRYKSDSFTKRELKGPKKGVDKWPMFFIKIKHTDPAINKVGTATTDLVGNEGGMIRSVIELLQAVVLEFLRSHRYRPKISQKLPPPQKARPMTLRSLTNLVQTSNINEHIGDPTLAKRIVRKQINVPSRAQSVGLNAVSAHSAGLKQQTHAGAYNQRIESPFDTWSRIKSGRSRLSGRKSDDGHEMGKTVAEEDSEVTVSNGRMCQSSASPVFTSRLSTEHTQVPMGYAGRAEPVKGQIEVRPIIARSGLVTHHPFSDVVVHAAKSNFGSRAVESVPSSSNGTQVDEGFMQWTNPATGKECVADNLIDLIIPSERPDMTKRLNTVACQSGSVEQVFGSNKVAVPVFTGKTASWLNDILQDWNNPVFCPAEAPIPQIYLDDSTGNTQQLQHGHRHGRSQLEIHQTLKESSAWLNGRISKEELCQAEIISQVDRKFILIKLPVCNSDTQGLEKHMKAETLVLVDQHAADERCRIETLLAELCKPAPFDRALSVAASPQTGVQTSRLDKPLSFVISQKEINLLARYSQHFANWGILYDLPPCKQDADQKHEQKVTVTSLPPGIIERCRTVPKLLIELLRSEAWKCFENRQINKPDREPTDQFWSAPGNLGDNCEHGWLTKLHGCPQGILEMLNSRSCRSAIMFNDELSNEQCKTLLSRLAECAFPFQCAHGRPSMVPLVDLGTFDQQKLSDMGQDFPKQEQLGTALKRWKRSMSEITDQDAESPHSPRESDRAELRLPIGATRN